MCNDDDRKPLESTRSPHWEAVRRVWIHAYPSCAACGGTASLQVHHIKPFHKHPDLELDIDNLITLCEAEARNCHYCFGHGYCWRGWNPQVVEDAARFLSRVRESAALADPPAAPQIEEDMA